MNRISLAPLATLLLASTALPEAAVAQVRLPTSQPAAPVLTPTGQAPVVQGAATRTASNGAAEALLGQADTQRKLGRKAQAAQALARALHETPNNPEVLRHYAQYAIEDGDLASAHTWTGRLRQATSAKDARVAALEKQLKSAEAPVTTATAAPAPAPTPAPERIQFAAASPPAAAPAPRKEVISRAPEARAPDSQAPPSPAPQAQAAAQPAPKPAADPGAEARTAGFLALNSGDLAGGERKFNEALRLRAGDLDASGGLGVIRLQQQRFSDARELLDRAVKGPQGTERWGQALATADFFYGLDKARTAYNAGRYGEAAQEARRLSDGSNPNRIEADILLGQALQRQGQAGPAEAAFRQAVALSPKRADAVTGLAQALADLGRYDEATRALADLPAGQAGQARATIARAQAADLLKRGDSFGAGVALSSAVIANPADPWTRFDYARLLLNQGQMAQSLGVAAPLYNSADPESLQAAALYSSARGRSAEAATILRRIPVNARNPAVRDLAAQFEGQDMLDQAKTLKLQGQAPQAIALLRGYLQRANPAFGLRGQIAQELFDLGDVYQAGALSLEAARSPPATFGPGEAGGYLSVLAQAGQDQAAMNLLTAASRQAQASPANMAAYRSLTAVYAGQRADRLRQANDFSDAFDTLSQAFALSPRDPGLLAALGRLYQAGNMPQQAQQAYDALMAVAPNDVDAIRSAAQAAQSAGDYPRSERLLRRAANLKPNDPELFYQIGQMEQSRGHDRDALKAFERADALIKAGRSQGILAPGLARQAGTGALGPNPFARGVPGGQAFDPASAYGAAPAARTVAASGYGAYGNLPAPGSVYGAGYIPQAAAPPMAAVAPGSNYIPLPQAQGVPGGYVMPGQAMPQPQYMAPQAMQPQPMPPQSMGAPQPIGAFGAGYIPMPQVQAGPGDDVMPGQAMLQFAPPPSEPSEVIPTGAMQADVMPDALPSQAMLPPPPLQAFGAGFIPLMAAADAAPATAQAQPRTQTQAQPAPVATPVYVPVTGYAYAGPAQVQAPAAVQTPVRTQAVPAPERRAAPRKAVARHRPAPARRATPVAAAPAPQQSTGAPYMPPDIAQAYAQQTGYAQPGAYPSVPANGGAYAPVAYAGAPPYGADPSPGFALPNPGGPPGPDAPLPARINSQISALRDNTAPVVEGEATLRTRSGEQGTSKLLEAGMRASASISPFGIGHLGVAVTPVIISAGAPNADAAANMGQVPLLEARAAVAAAAAAAGTTVAAPKLNTSDSIHASGAGISVFYQSDPLQFDIGTTPAGFQVINPSGGVSGHLQLGPNAALRGGVEERPVTDSVLSYAGVSDPVTGTKTGSVMRESASFGGSANFGEGGAYADGTYKQFHGNNVAPNTGYEVNAGVYYRPIDADGNRLQVGVNVNMQSFQKNLRFFSFGQGGYFSPQQFVSVAFPVTWSVQRNKFSYSLGVTLGMQSYSEDSSPYFPTIASAQSALEGYASGVSTVNAKYAGQDKTGVAVAAIASGEYKILPNTATGAEISIDTFGIYSEYKLRFYMRRLLTSNLY